MYSKEEVLEYVLSEDVKFIKLAFCDVFGVQKNISILSTELERAFGNDISIVKMPTPLYVKCVLKFSVSFSSAEKMLAQGERAVKIICVNESTEKLTLAFSVSSVPLQFIKGDVSRIRQCFCELNSKQNY